MNSIPGRFRKWVLKTFRPIIGMLGRITTSSGGSISDSQVDTLYQMTQVGDVILSRVDGEILNWFIPGFYSHAAIVCEDGRLVEAVGKGVREVFLSKFLSNKDHIGVYRSNQGKNRIQAGMHSRDYLGRSYDYGFQIGDEDFYCSELVWQAYRDTHPDMEFCKRDIFGVKTILPDDFTCVEYWDNVQSIIGNQGRV